MDLVEYHLKLVINLWCGAVPAQYTTDSQLRDIWGDQIPNPAIDYDTYGVPSFMKQMYQDSLFSSCKSAHDITSGELITGGGLQTFSSVYMALAPCANSVMLTKATPAFAEAVLTPRPKSNTGSKKPVAGKSAKGKD